MRPPAFRSMALSVVALACCAPSWAHRLVPDDGSHVDAASALAIEDPTLSQVVYHDVKAGSPRLWLTFNAEQGDSLHLELGVPKIAGLEEYRPALALLGPGLPAVQLPFDIPEGLGAVLLPTDDVTPEPFYERFTGTDSWTLLSQDIPLPSSGRYYLVAYDPQGETGKLFVAIGKREAFTLADFLAYPETVDYVRTFYGVNDQSLPLLPRVLVAAATIVRFVLSIFGWT